MPNCTITLANVAKGTCPNRSGLSELLHATVRTDIATIGAATNHSVSTVTMEATKKFVVIEAVRENNSQDSTPNDNGTFDTEIKYFVPHQEATKSAVFTQMTGGSDAFVAITDDRNGEKNIIGTKTHGCMMKAKAVKTPKNGYELTISWTDHDNLPLFFTGTIPIV